MSSLRGQPSLRPTYGCGLSPQTNLPPPKQRLNGSLRQPNAGFNVPSAGQKKTNFLFASQQERLLHVTCPRHTPRPKRLRLSPAWALESPPLPGLGQSHGPSRCLQRIRRKNGLQWASLEMPNLVSLRNSQMEAIQNASDRCVPFTQNN